MFFSGAAEIDEDEGPVFVFRELRRDCRLADPTRAFKQDGSRPIAFFLPLFQFVLRFPFEHMNASFSKML